MYTGLVESSAELVGVCLVADIIVGLHHPIISVATLLGWLPPIHHELFDSKKEKAQERMVGDFLASQKTLR